MASEIRVDKINSLSGVGTVTLSPTGVDIAGITTAATLRATTGIVTSLTAVSSAKVGSGVTLSPDGDIFATGVTTSTTFVGNLTGNVTGTLQTAAQTNITSVGSLSSLVVTGGITATGGNIVMNDSSGSSANRIKLGTSQDLSLYHNGSQSIIEDSVGSELRIRANTIRLRNAADNEQYANFNNNGAVELYHDNAKKLETHTQGAAIGQVSTIPTMSDFSCQILAGNSGFIGNYHSGSNQQLIIGLNQYYDGAYKAPDNNVSQQLQFYNKKFNFITAPAPGSDNGAVTNTNILTIDGDGVKFGTDTAAANALDDYEEGTFTPRFQTSNGNWSGNHTTQDGSYTKIGNIVHVRIRLHWSSVGGSGMFRITALPFTVANTGSNEGGGVTIGPRSGFNYSQITSFFRLNNQQLQFQYIASSAPYGSFDVSVGALATSGHAYVSGWYEVA